MPEAPKPKKPRKRKTGNPWLDTPTTPPPGHDTVGEAYIEEKQHAIAFWMRGEATMPYVKAICCVCETRLYRHDHPQTHHGIIPRNYGVTVNEWWNLFPVCSEHCHNLLEGKTVQKQVRDKLYLKIALFILERPNNSLADAKAWLQAQIDRLVAEGKIDGRSKPLA